MREITDVYKVPLVFLRCDGTGCVVLFKAISYMYHNHSSFPEREQEKFMKIVSLKEMMIKVTPDNFD